MRKRDDLLWCSCAVFIGETSSRPETIAPQLVHGVRGVGRFISKRNIRLWDERLRERFGVAASGAGVWCDARERRLDYAGTSGVSRKIFR